MPYTAAFYSPRYRHRFHPQHARLSFFNVVLAASFRVPQYSVSLVYSHIQNCQPLFLFLPYFPKLTVFSNLCQPLKNPLVRFLALGGLELPVQMLDTVTSIQLPLGYPDFQSDLALEYRALLATTHTRMHGRLMYSQCILLSYV